MVLTAKETAVAAGGLVASALPTGFQLAEGPDMATSLANAIFEGDKGAARIWGGAAFLLAAAVLGGAAVVGPLNGTYGHLSLGGGFACLMMALVVVVEGGR